MRKAAHRIQAARRAKLRREQREAFASLPGGVSLETLNAIAACESGGDPTAVSSNGTYRGKYQFDYGTWESVGGSGDPAAASEAEQDYRAALLYSQSGSSPWPICG
jgi:soluble lytic murein transglycosylase-like protein